MSFEKHPNEGPLDFQYIYIIYLAAKKLTPVNMLKLWAIGVELDHPARNNFVNRGCPEVILCRPSSYNSPLLVQSVHCCSVLLWSVLSKLFFAVQWGFPKAGGEEGIYIRQTTCICLAQPSTLHHKHYYTMGFFCLSRGRIHAFVLEQPATLH